MPEPSTGNDQGGVQSRPNLASGGGLLFRKRHEAAGYRALLAIVLLLVIWFLASSISDGGNAKDAEATAIATRFAPETAVADELTATAE